MKYPISKWRQTREGRSSIGRPPYGHTRASLLASKHCIRNYPRMPRISDSSYHALATILWFQSRDRLHSRLLRPHHPRKQQVFQLNSQRHQHQAPQPLFRSLQCKWAHNALEPSCHSDSIWLACGLWIELWKQLVGCTKWTLDRRLGHNEGRYELPGVAGVPLVHCMIQILFGWEYHMGQEAPKLRKSWSSGAEHRNESQDMRGLLWY